MYPKGLKAGLMICVVFIAFVGQISALLFAQDMNRALRDYDRGRFDDVREALIVLKDTAYNKPEYLFLSAVFEEDAEHAFALLSKLNANFQDNQIFERVLWRMCQYYYAKGLYETCGEALGRFIQTFPDSDFREIALDKRSRITAHLGLTFQENDPVKEEPVIIYTLQFGAFGTESSARGQLRYLRNLGINESYIVEKQIGTGILFKIWSGEFTNKADAERIRDQLMRRYKITDIIVTEKNNYFVPSLFFSQRQ